jgi:RNA polymerase sigma-70 factor (ECF subfamily)
MGNSPRYGFDHLMLPHLTAAYNLAHWITKNPDAAADVVQESFVRALRFFDDFRGDNARAWLLAIVRNTSLNWLAKTRNERTVPLAAGDDEDGEGIQDIPDDKIDSEMALIQKDAVATLDQLIATLPVDYREVVILREIEELSYKDIAAVMGVPLGTVMSRLARARQALQKHWKNLPENRGKNEM